MGATQSITLVFTDLVRPRDLVAALVADTTYVALREHSPSPLAHHDHVSQKHIRLVGE